MAFCAVPAAQRRLPRLPPRETRPRAAGVGASQSVAITVGGLSRRYLLHVPNGVAAAAPLPLVLVFHGGSDTPENTESMTGFSALADRERFIVAYLDGIDHSWADGRHTTSADKKGVDDVAFTRAVIDDVRKRHGVDAKRIFATGPSNGGLFSSRLGCDLADALAAVGPVIGTIATDLAPRCRPAAPIAVAAIQGVDDPLMPFAGGEEGGTRHLGEGGPIEGARATQELWRTLNGCDARVTETKLPARVNDGTSVTKRAFSNCRGGTDVVWYEIAGGGHRWPPQRAQGMQEAIARRTFGASSQNLDATQVLWQFFNEHPKR